MNLNIENKLQDIITKNGTRFQAIVLISAKGVNKYNGRLYVGIDKSKNNVKIYIEGDEAFYRDYNSQYTINDNVNIIVNTIQIRTKDVFGNDISLEITPTGK